MGLFQNAEFTLRLCTGMGETYDPLLGTWVVQGTVFHRLGAMLTCSQGRISSIWRRVEPLVFVGTAVSLGWAAWRYYDRKAALRTYGRHMTGKAVGLVVGRDDEIDRVISILCRKTKNCAALVGPAGVGKTAIAEGLAQRIATGKVPAALAGARVVEVDLGAMVAGTPALARGRIRCVGATTFDGYRNYIEKDPALERRFQKVHIEEPSTQATVGILRGLKQQYEQHHGLEIQDAALVAAAQLAGRYITGRQFPDKAIDLIDEACSATIKRLIQIDNQAEGLNVVSLWTGIPVCTLEEEDKDKLIHLADRLHERVVGQNEAVNVVAEAVLRSRAGLNHPGQPIGSFLFLGSTGVGKTELAKALAEQLFASEKMLVRFDMSEYVGSGSVLRLVGAPPSHQGCDDGGQLTEKVRRRPYSVILFDEVEKADPSVLNVFIQLLDDGVLTDGKGRIVNFKNTIIIMTSNLGAEHLTAGMAGEITMDAARDLLMKQVQKHFKPELLNRLSEIVVFEPLLHDKLKEIVKIQMKSIISRVADKGISLFASDAVLDVILSESHTTQCMVQGP
uniref:AAA+ ATPase domain-containing protein n=1 Tax=Aegilops tauschii subsp. strangulata TaxID=200361 RepID=A0A453LZH1_AEGTS